jgi:hypothetical protein
MDFTDQMATLVEGLGATLLESPLRSILLEFEGEISDEVTCLTSGHDLDHVIGLQESQASVKVGAESPLG